MVQTGGTEKTFNVTLTQDAIDDQTEENSGQAKDFVVVSQENLGLRKIESAILCRCGNSPRWLNAHAGATAPQDICYVTDEVSL